MITRALRERKPYKGRPVTTASLDLDGIFTLRAQNPLVNTSCHCKP